MKKSIILLALVSLLAGCHSSEASYVESDSINENESESISEVAFEYDFLNADYENKKIQKQLINKTPYSKDGLECMFLFNIYKDNIFRVEQRFCDLRISYYYFGMWKKEQDSYSCKTLYLAKDMANLDDFRQDFSINIDDNKNLIIDEFNFALDDGRRDNVKLRSSDIIFFETQDDFRKTYDHLDALVQFSGDNINGDGIISIVGFQDNSCSIFNTVTYNGYYYSPVNISNGVFSFKEENGKINEFTFDFSLIDEIGYSYTIKRNETDDFATFDLEFTKNSAVYKATLSKVETPYLDKKGQTNCPPKEGNKSEYSFSKIQKTENSKLTNKNIAVLGSSVAYGAYSGGNSIGEYFQNRFGCNLYKQTISGTTLSTIKADSYCDRIKRFDEDVNYGLMFVQLSTNDATNKVEIGEINSSKNKEDFDTTKVAGAIEYILTYAKDILHTKVVFFTNCKYESDHYAKMVEFIKSDKLATKYDFMLLNLYDDVDFNSITEEQRALYMHDEIHPTLAGYRDWWGKKWESDLLSLL